MNHLKRLFHFLGGIHLAIALIGAAAAIVVAGTLLESLTGSHLFAARWTYESPFFQLLLSLFFINILFSALRRWPFQIRHIPFLITHVGLLMIIGGTMIKNRFGLQGQMSVWEGSASRQVLLPHTYAIYLEGKEPGIRQVKSSMMPLDSFRQNIFFPHHFPDVKCKLIGYAPHAAEKPEAWIKESKGYLSGFPPLPVQNWDISQPLPPGSSHLRAMGNSLETWSIKILRTAHVQEAILQTYLEGLTLRMKEKDGTVDPLEIPLQKALQEPFTYADALFSLSLHFPADHTSALFLALNWASAEGGGKGKFSISLKGDNALFIQSDPVDVLKPRFTVDLSRPHPSLCLVEDPEGKTHFFAFDRYGRIHGETFDPSKLKSLVSYDEGFGGYSVQAVVPIPSFPAAREDKERADAFQLVGQLKAALASGPSLAPPLQFFNEACRKAHVEFAAAFIQFLTEWNRAPSFLFNTKNALPSPLDQVLNNLDWKEITGKDLQGALWTCRLFEQLEDGMRHGDSLLNQLESNQWPFIQEIKEEMDNPRPSPLNLLAQQISGLIPFLPALESHNEQAALLSAYLRIYGIDYQSLFPAREGDKEDFEGLEAYWKAQPSFAEAKIQQSIIFETPLTNQIIPETPPLKLEDRRPGIVLEIQQGQDKQTFALAYDSTASGMKWPVLKGNFVARLQPDSRELPYRLRLRQARQISYPQSSQVYSYESDLLITEDGKLPISQTLSMNHVHETWDGYRFYLSGIGKSADSSLNHIQLAVNHDPAKYILTYPGALLVFTGIILLFWVLPYYKKIK